MRYPIHREMDDADHAGVRLVGPGRNFQIGNCKKAASEIIGTILVLGISITMMGVFSTWLFTIDDDLPAGIQTELDITYTPYHLNITHMGGDPIYSSDVEINAFIGSRTYTWHILDDLSAGNENGTISDGIWEFNEVWSKEIGEEVLSESAGGWTPEISVNIVFLPDSITLAFADYSSSRMNYIRPDIALSDDNITISVSGFEVESIKMDDTLPDVSFIMSNVGPIPVAGFSAVLTINNEKVTEYYDPNILNPGQSLDIQFNAEDFHPVLNDTFGVFVFGVRLICMEEEEDLSNNYAERTFNIITETGTVKTPQLLFDVSEDPTVDDDVDFSKHPVVHGDTIQIYITIHNIGKGDLDMVKYNPFNINIEHEKSGWSDNRYVDWGIPSGDVVQVSFTWLARPGGLSQFTISVENDEISGHDTIPGLDDLVGSPLINVVPTVLLVDDDGVNDGEMVISFETMRDSLTASGVPFDTYQSVGVNDPPYSSTMTAGLEEYDIVIWVTGYDEDNTLTDENIDAITMYLDGGGYLWLVGQDIIEEIHGNHSSFCEDYLGFETYNEDVGTGSGVWGNSTSNITNHIGRMTLPFFKNDDNADTLGLSAMGKAILTVDNDDDKTVGTYVERFNSAQNTTARIVFMPWAFSAMYPTDQVNLVYSVMDKAFNWSISFGTDFSIANQNISNTQPRYFDYIYINSTIQNNGPEGRLVDVLFRVTDPDGVENPVPIFEDDVITNPVSIWIDGNGSKVNLSKLWFASRVGFHVFSVMVDPFGEYEEMLETNNMITYRRDAADVTEVTVAFTILVVDDDESANNLGGHRNVTGQFVEALDYLDYEYTEHVVLNGTDGPDLDRMKVYKSVVWITGQAQTNTLTATDQTEISAYLDGVFPEADVIEGLECNFWLMGQDILDDLEGTSDLVNRTVPVDRFARDYLGVERYRTNVDLPAVLVGQSNDPISHGHQIQTGKYFTDRSDSIQPTADAERFLFSTTTGNHSVHLERENGQGMEKDGVFRVVFSSWEFSFLVDPWLDQDGPGTREDTSTDIHNEEVMYRPYDESIESDDGVESHDDGVESHDGDESVEGAEERTDPSLRAPVVAFEDSFEDGDWNSPDWTSNDYGEAQVLTFQDGGSGNDDINPDPAGGTYFGQIRGGSTYAETPTIDMSSYNEASLNFKWACTSFDNSNDDAFLDFFYDGTWHNIITWTDGDDDLHPPWQQETVTFNLMDDPDYFDNNFKFRFRMSGSCGGWDYFAFDIITLNALTAEPPVITDAKVSPLTGSTQTAFRFSATYTQGNGDLPTQAEVVIDSVTYDLFPQDPGDNDVTDGKVYYYSTFLSVGSHDFYFNFKDHFTLVREPASGTFSGPFVFGASLTNPTATPAIGTPATIFNFTVVYTNSSGDPPDQSKLYINNDHYDMIKDPTDDIFTNGVTYYLTLSLPLGYHSHYFNFEGVRLPIYGQYPGPKVLTATGIGNDSAGSRAEMTYMIIGWFGQLDTRLEFSTYCSDITLSDEHLVLGNSYVISSRVYNHGQSSGTTTVRFLDGQNIVNSMSIFVPADTYSTISTVYKPLFAGNRPLSVWVDPENEKSEVFDWYNNIQINEDFYVYYFHDDMENGYSNWEHDSTLVRINGESPLEFVQLHEDEIYVDVESDWAERDGFYYTVRDGHTNPACYYAQEPEVNPSANLDILFNFDYSGSMNTATKWPEAQIAAKIFIDLLNDDDRVCIQFFSGSDPWWPSVANLTMPTWVTCDADGRDDLKWFIDQYNNPNGNTPLYESIDRDNYGIDWLEDNYDSAEATPAMVILSDGQDTSSASSYNVNTARSAIQNANDIIYVYTIGLGVAHDPDLTMNPATEAPSPQGSYPLEWELFHFAQDSKVGAEGKFGYFYAPSGDELANVFTQIAEDLAGSAVARRSDDGPGLRMEPGNITYRHMITPTFALTDVDSATLTFFHKYNITLGLNGGLVTVGTKDGGDWKWHYISPINTYPSNLLVTKNITDDFNNTMTFCYNGISANGLFDWEYAEFDLSQFIGEDEVRVNFTFIDFAIGSGGFWWVDDVEIKVSRDDEVSPTSDTKDQWEHAQTSYAHSGEYSWWLRDPILNSLKGGQDTSLYTRVIDLTNAKDAKLSAYFRFNINISQGLPPDSFRVEVTSDNGKTWVPLSRGVRALWGVSGTAELADDGGTWPVDDGILDGKTYMGIDYNGDGWIEADTLIRLETDLTGWSGSVIRLRFRMVTASDDNPYFGSQHYESPTASTPGGIFIDDVVVKGSTQLGGEMTDTRQSPDPRSIWPLVGSSDISPIPVGICNQFIPATIPSVIVSSGEEQGEKKTCESSEDDDARDASASATGSMAYASPILVAGVASAAGGCRSRFHHGVLIGEQKEQSKKRRRSL